MTIVHVADTKQRTVFTDLIVKHFFKFRCSSENELPLSQSEAKTFHCVCVMWYNVVSRISIYN